VKNKSDKPKDFIRRPNPNRLPLFVALAVFVALIIGALLFWLMYKLFYEPKQANLYDVTRTVIAALAALTVGGAAMIQYRKHKIAEIDLVDRQAAQAAQLEAQKAQQEAQEKQLQALLQAQAAQQAAQEKQLQAQLQAQAAQQEAQEKQLQAQLQAQADTHDAKMSERLSMAIEHLADEKLHIRIGALYELRRLVEDSQRDRASIQEIITQFLNGKQEEIEELSRPDKDSLPKNERGRIAFDKLPPLPSDIAVALNMLFFSYEKYRDDYIEECKISWDYLDARYLNLSALPFVKASLREACFDGAYLGGAHFDGAILGDAHFDGAGLRGARFDVAWLLNAHFDGANLEYAHFDNAYLSSTYFNGANLEDAHFVGANLEHAHFDGAYLGDAHFDSASIYGVDFSNARYLTPKQFENVKYHTFTKFPDGFKLPASAKFTNFS
jgi:uncharacterized protein YjbI with pentapeptide repeats